MFGNTLNPHPPALKRITKRNYVQNRKSTQDIFLEEYWKSHRRNKQKIYNGRQLKPVKPQTKMTRNRKRRQSVLSKINDLSRNGALLTINPGNSMASVSKTHGYLFDKDIKSLCEKTGYNRRELYALFVRFKALCTLSYEITGNCNGIDKETFRRGVLMLSVEDDMFVDRVFSVLDEDGSGTIEWAEFINAMSSLERGTSESKAQFLFKVYDRDKDGGISKDELLQFFLSSLMVKVDDDIMEVSETFVSNVFDEVDLDGDNRIYVEEALEYIKRHPEVKDIYGMFGRSMTSEQLDGLSQW